MCITHIFLPLITSLFCFLFADLTIFTHTNAYITRILGDYNGTENKRNSQPSHINDR